MIFQEKGCSQCHAVYGKNGKGGPDLGKHKFFGTYLDLAALMWNHFPKMYKKMQKMGYQHQDFTEEEMAQLVSYISFIRYMGEPGDENIGKKLLKSKGCKSCHKFGGDGGDLGPDISKKEEYLSPLMFVESMWNHGPDMMELFQDNNIRRPEFNDNDIVDIAAAVRSYMSPSKVPVGTFDVGDPAKGKKILDDKRCMHCHSNSKVVEEIGPDFFDIELNYSVTQIAGSMWNHGPKMWEMMEAEGISFPTFRGQEMADMIAYLYSLNLEDSPGNSEMGKKVIHDRGCLSCHSLNEKGDQIAVDLAKVEELNSPLAMITAMWNHAPSMQEESLGKKINWPKLSGNDMADLYAFLHQDSLSK
jgi:cytochrome c551/c552